MIKMTVMDIDGTLLPEAAGQVPERTALALRRLADTGVLVLLASGRPYVGMARVFSPISDRFLYSCSGGGCVIRGGQAVSVTPLEDFAELAAILRSLGRAFTCDTPYGCYTENAPRALVERTRKAGIDIQVVEDILAVRDPVVKVSIACPDGGPSAHMEDPQILRIREKWEAMESGTLYIDVISPRAGKGAGVRKVRTLYGLEPEEVAVFGDAANDVSMFRETPNSYCVETAPGLVRSQAAFSIAPPGDFGVTAYLEKLADEAGRRA